MGSRFISALRQTFKWAFRFSLITMSSSHESLATHGIYGLSREKAQTAARLAPCKQDNYSLFALSNPFLKVNGSAFTSDYEHYFDVWRAFLLLRYQSPDYTPEFDLIKNDATKPSNDRLISSWKSFQSGLSQEKGLWPWPWCGCVFLNISPTILPFHRASD